MKPIIILAGLFGTQVLAIRSPDFSSAPPAPAGLTREALIGGSPVEKRQGCTICPTCGNLGGLLFAAPRLANASNSHVWIVKLGTALLWAED